MTTTVKRNEQITRESNMVTYYISYRTENDDEGEFELNIDDDHDLETLTEAIEQHLITIYESQHGDYVDLDGKQKPIVTLPTAIWIYPDQVSCDEGGGSPHINIDVRFRNPRA